MRETEDGGVVWCVQGQGREAYLTNVLGRDLGDGALVTERGRDKLVLEGLAVGGRVDEAAFG
jgi:hypothetical protein